MASTHQLGITTPAVYHIHPPTVIHMVLRYIQLMIMALFVKVPSAG